MNNQRINFFNRSRAALVQAVQNQAEEIETIIIMIDENRLFEAESRLVALLPPAEMGRASFSTNCAPCHGDDGSGGIGPNLLTNSFIQTQEDEGLIDFILEGRRGTAMDGFDGILGNDVINNIVALLREWQE
ncbi:MAG: cytochrome c [Anaerolineales bacterium]|uniref:Cytochrome c n=1 Tax=Candidatus Desulfolinea nitratireducens TaxID=2841698 RepID=A0A8J6NNT6_9CHLR|nr:cytochrome c [Candidatus Desulfolinea nitratireducens]